MRKLLILTLIMQDPFIKFETLQCITLIRNAVKKAGVSTVGITYGYGTREELLAAGAIWVVDTPEEVVALF